MSSVEADSISSALAAKCSKDTKNPPVVVLREPAATVQPRYRERLSRFIKETINRK